MNALEAMAGSRLKQAGWQGDASSGPSWREQRALLFSAVLLMALVLLFLAGILAMEPADAGKDPAYPMPRSAPAAERFSTGNRSDSAIS
jgi:hypothetical protein